jgi:cytochrome c peroxidase
MRFSNLRTLAVCSVLFLVIGACDRKKEEEPQQDEQAEQSLREQAREQFGVIEPVEGLNEDKVALGKKLFHDKNLSGDGTISCSSCHTISEGGDDGQVTSTGINHQEGPINSPTVLNAHLNVDQFWDGRADDLQSQASGPIANDVEMGSSMTATIDYLDDVEPYSAAFQEIYDGEITEETVTDAIAEFEKTLTTPNAPFDQWLQGDDSALSEQERRGLQTFIDVGCPTCHVGPGLGGTMYQKMGLVKDYFEMRGGEITDADLGRYNVTEKESDKHRFKVPLLRNIELTAPYFHDGSRESLDEAVKIMADIQLGQDLSEQQVDDIVAFLESLTGDLPDIDVASLNIPEARKAGVDQPGENPDNDQKPETESGDNVESN